MLTQEKSFTKATQDPRIPNVALIGAEEDYMTQRLQSSMHELKLFEGALPPRVDYLFSSGEDDRRLYEKTDRLLQHRYHNLVFSVGLYTTKIVGAVIMKRKVKALQNFVMFMTSQEDIDTYFDNLKGNNPHNMRVHIHGNDADEPHIKNIGDIFGRYLGFHEKREILSHTHFKAQRKKYWGGTEYGLGIIGTFETPKLEFYERGWNRAHYEKETNSGSSSKQ